MVDDASIKKMVFRGWMDIDTLIPYDKNPRQHEDKDLAFLMRSLEYFGWRQPVQVQRGTNVLIAGHGRIEAAKRLGLTKAPVIEMEDDVPVEDDDAYRITDNASAELSRWHPYYLRENLVNLDTGGFDLSLTGFDDHYLKEAMEADAGRGLTDDDAVPEPPEKPITKLGDIYKLGEHRLICGDALSIDSINKLLDGEKADLVFTDPPYNVNYEGYTEEKLKIKNDKMTPEKFQAFLEDTFASYRMAVKDGGSLYVCHPSLFQREFQNAMEKAGFEVRCQIIWAKNTFAWGFGRYKFQHEPIFYAYVRGESDPWYGDKSQSTLWEEKKPAANRLHPTMKPVELVSRAIYNSSKAGDLVLDLFGGSGTTLIAAEKLHRRCFLSELDPVYCDVIVKRWEQFTGSKADLI
jgi:DNA modification methylase